MKVEMRKAIFNKDSNQPPLSEGRLSKEGTAPPGIGYRDIRYKGSGYRGIPCIALISLIPTISLLCEKGQVISSRHNIRYGTNISV